MLWTEWMANQHTFFVHLPAAVAILLPIPLIMAQRMGRGIRPWWLTCRYLAIMGFLGLILTMISGYASVPSVSLLKSFALTSSRAGTTASLVYHQFFATLSLVLGVLCLMGMFRKRKDHESLGMLALVMGFLWAASILVAHHYGHGITKAAEEAPKKVAPVPPPPQVPVQKEDPESQVPVRALDFLRLTPIQPEPVKSMPHGNRWIRVWVSPEAAEAYRTGKSLPDGALVVMNSLEDRWGRPGLDAGPLYALEVKGGKPSLTYYWGRVPEAKRPEVGGAERAYWRGSDPNLKPCLECHGQGTAAAKDRSRWVVPHKPKSGSN